MPDAPIALTAGDATDPLLVGVAAGVGSLVGTCVGTGVGTFVGLGVGTFVGCGVGFGVGLGVGCGVGAMLQALRDLTDRGHMILVAEGIETREQLEVVRSLGFAAGQGYLLAPPYPLVNPEPIDLDLLAADPFARIHAA